MRTRGEGEFDLIARIFAPLATDPGGLDLRDDAAVLHVTEGHELVVSCDTLIEGVHFLGDDPAESVGHKALAVNLSDLTAKGAAGHAYTLSLAVPDGVPTEWLEAFADGLRRVQDLTGISLIGGDTTASPGPLTITITVLGLVWIQNAVLRRGARPGDRLYVSGTIGDAYLGLRLLQEPSLAGAWALTEEERAFLVGRYRRPEVDPNLALLVRNFAKAAIDVSDGLIGDVEKLCDVSSVGAEIDVRRTPLSPPARKALSCEPDLLPVLITAGDDYCVAAAVSEKSSAAFESEAKAAGTAVAEIGRLVPEATGVRVTGPDGQALALKTKGFRHF